MACPPTCRPATVISDGTAKLRIRDLRDPLALIATGFGCGLAPYAPGTVGSLLGAASWWFLLAGFDGFTQAGIAFIAFAMGVWMIDRLGKRLGLGDEPAVVWDEVVGCWIALSTVPKSLPWVVAAFVLFRIGDIAKPWPISWADRSVKGGLGVMLDDVLAGLAVAATLYAAQLLI